METFRLMLIIVVIINLDYRSKIINIKTLETQEQYLIEELREIAMLLYTIHSIGFYRNIAKIVRQSFEITSNASAEREDRPHKWSERSKTIQRPTTTPRTFVHGPLQLHSRIYAHRCAESISDEKITKVGSISAVSYCSRVPQHVVVYKILK